MDLSVLCTRKPEILRRAFSLVPEYLRTERDGEVTNYMDYGIPLGRRFRALKLWFVLRYFGTAGLGARIREHVRLAHQLASWIDEHPHFERMAPVPLSTVCLRARPAGYEQGIDLNELNEKLLRAVNQTGEAFLSHTKLQEQYVIRFVISHLRVTEQDVKRVWEIIQDRLKAIMA